MLVTLENWDLLVASIEGATVIGLDTEAYGPTTLWAPENKDKNFVEANNALPACITVSTGMKNFYIPVNSQGARPIAKEKIVNFLECLLKKTLVIHNALYDIRVIENYLGYKWRPLKLYDTMLLSWLTDMGAPTPKGKKSNGLKELSKYYFNYKMGHFEDIAWENSQLSLFDACPDKKRGRLRQSNEIPYQDLIEYAEEDAEYAVRLFEILHPKLRAMGYADNYELLELPFLYLLIDMQYMGIQFDASAIDRIRKDCEAEVSELEQAWNTIAGCSITSTKEIIENVYDRLHYWDRNLAPLTPGGAPACNMKALDVLDKLLPDGPGKQLIDIKRKHSKAYKILTTYTYSLAEQIKYRSDGRIRSNFFQAGTDTGRLSSRGPNLQNQPAPRPGALPVRSAFVASPGRSLISADYGALEVRIMCHWSRDPMLTTFLLEGRDMHQYVADQINKPRSAAKAAFFAWCYGGRAGTVASNLRLPMEEAESLINGLDEIYGGVTEWRKSIALECLTNGYVTTLLGRRRYLPGIYAMDEYEKNPAQFHRQARAKIATDPYTMARLDQKGIRHDSSRAIDFVSRSIAMRRRLGAERQAANTPIQGSAADIAKLSGIHLASGIEEQEMPLDIILQVHDEWCFEVDDNFITEAEPFIKTTMENCVTLNIPLIVSVGHGKSLYECK